MLPPDFSIPEFYHLIDARAARSAVASRTINPGLQKADNTDPLTSIFLIALMKEVSSGPSQGTQSTGVLSGIT